MTKRLAVGALMGALMVAATGCTSSDECIDRFDCSNNKGSPGLNKTWACVDHKCEAQDEVPGADAGTPDSGTTTPDSGTTTPDSGTMTPDAGTPDSGTTTPADMTIKEGDPCTTTASCMAGLYCASSKCAQLSIAVTVASTSDPSNAHAALALYNTPSAGPTMLDESATVTSRFPRWNRGGTAVAFVESTTDSSGGTPVTSVSLVSRTFPLTAGTTTLTTGANAGSTTDFSYMEWDPSNTAAWCTTTTQGTTGVWTFTPGDTAAKAATARGVFPSWAADGQSFVYSVATVGLLNHTLTGGSDPTVLASATQLEPEQPMHNNANGVLLYLDAKGVSDPVIGPLWSLYTLDTSSTPQLVAQARDEPQVPATGGTVRSYVVNHTWSPTGTHAAYVRAYYFTPAGGSGTIHLCQGTGDADCGGQDGNVIFVRHIDTATGSPSGDELEFVRQATLPSFSPDGRFIAYLSGSQLKVQQIDPTATAAASIKVGSVISHSWSGNSLRVLSNRGDDHRPRWQPR